MGRVKSRIRERPAMGDRDFGCTNCGAPLIASDSGRFLFCEHCGASAALPPPRTDDRVTPLGHALEANCPSCGGALADGLMDHFRVGHCPGCRGVLLAGEDFAAVVRSRRASYRRADAAPVPLEPLELERRVDCPRCRSPMEVHPYYGPGNTVIDSCRTCGLVWLDQGEIARIERAPGRR
jgi:Zn-finger nucleic acid-binding protein